jgi:hypothetical protein
MIPYEELVAQLARWRAQQGLPTGPADYLGEPAPVSYDYVSSVAPGYRAETDDTEDVVDMSEVVEEGSMPAYEGPRDEWAASGDADPAYGGQAEYGYAEEGGGAYGEQAYDEEVVVQAEGDYEEVLAAEPGQDLHEEELAGADDPADIDAFLDSALPSDDVTAEASPIEPAEEPEPSPPGGRRKRKR